MRAAAAALAALALAAPAHAAHRWHGRSGDDAGHGVVSQGEAIWTSYLYDDYGANVDGFRSMDPDLFVGLLSPHVYADDPSRPLGFAPSGNVGRFRHTGDYGYPPAAATDPAADPLGDTAAFDNRADVTEVRVAATRRHVFLRFRLTDLGGDPTLAEPREAGTVIGLAIDTDRDAATGGGDWPFGARLQSPGWDRFLTVWGTGGALDRPDGTTTKLKGVRQNLATNTIQVRLRRSQVPGTRWRLIAGAGRWDGAAWAEPEATTTQTTSPGSGGRYPRVYELPFHHGEPNSLWNETRQADDLAAGDVSAHHWDVDLTQLRRRATVTEPCRTGPRQETFRSAVPSPATAEGMTALPTQNGGAANSHNVNYVYRWRLQPLALMLPPSACDAQLPAPSLDYFFHPANVNQNAWLVGVEGDADRVNYLSDPPLDYSHVTELAARHNRITAAGLGKTEGWNYGDAPGEEAADKAAFDATLRRHRVDREHVRVTGMSGRLGPPAFAETWPDLVSAIVTVSAHTADSPRIVNLRNTPWVFMHGTAHLELQSDLPSYDVLDAHLHDLGYQYLHMTWDGRGHDFGLVNRSYELVEPWTAAARIHPARLTYYVDPDHRPLGLPLFPRVDWLRQMRLADPNRPSQVDLTDRAHAEALPTRATEIDCAFTNAATTDHVVYHGLYDQPPAVLHTWMPDRVEAGWTADRCDLTEKRLERPATADAITGTLENVSRISLRIGRLHPDLSGIETKTPVRVRLRARGRTRTVTLQPH